MGLLDTRDIEETYDNFTKATNEQIICTYLWLFDKKIFFQLMDIDFAISHSLKYGALSTVLIKLCCRRGREELKLLLERYKNVIMSSSALLYSVLINFNREFYQDFRHFLIKSIGFIVEKGDKLSALLALKRLLSIDSFAAVDYEQFLLESYFQTYDEQVKKYALESIILTLNQYNANFIRKILEKELFQTFDAEKFSFFLKTFLLATENKEEISIALKSFYPQVHQHFTEILSFLNDELQTYFLHEWNKVCQQHINKRT